MYPTLQGLASPKDCTELLKRARSLGFFVWWFASRQNIAISRFGENVSRAEKVGELHSLSAVSLSIIKWTKHLSLSLLRAEGMA